MDPQEKTIAHFILATKKRNYKASNQKCLEIQNSNKLIINPKGLSANSAHWVAYQKLKETVMAIPKATCKDGNGKGRATAAANYVQREAKCEWSGGESLCLRVWVSEWVWGPVCCEWVFGDIVLIKHHGIRLLRCKTMSC